MSGLPPYYHLVRNYPLPVYQHAPQRPQHGSLQQHGSSPQYVPQHGSSPQYVPQYGHSPQYVPQYRHSPQYVPQYGPSPQYVPQYGPSPQYVAGPTQQSRTPTLTPNQAHQLYLHQMATASHPPLQPMAQQPANSFKKEKKMIRIQEPETLRDVIEDIINEESSGDPCAKENSPEESDRLKSLHVAAMFAKQVADLAFETSNKPQLQSVSVDMNQQSSNMNTTIAESQEINRNVQLPRSDDLSESTAIVVNSVNTESSETESANNGKAINVKEITDKEEIIESTAIVVNSVNTESSETESANNGIATKITNKEVPTAVKKETVSKAQVTDFVELLESECERLEILNNSHVTCKDNDKAEKNEEALENSNEEDEEVLKHSTTSGTNTIVNEREMTVESQHLHYEEHKVTSHQIIEMQSIIEKSLGMEEAEENKETLEETTKEHIATTVNYQQSNIKLKYTYSNEQWSPLNPEGKKRYDRSFLMQIQRDPLSLIKPIGLPDVEVVKDKPTFQKLPEINRLPVTSLGSQSHTGMFMPNYATRSGNSRMSSDGPNRSQKQRSRDSKSNKQLDIPDVKLHKCETAWKSSYKKKATDDEEEQTQELLKKARSILNKLTPQKFDSLVEQMKNLAINTETRLYSVIELVFEKAIDEPKFSVSYANMCKHLALMQVPVSGEDAKQKVNFRKALLTKCQREFEKDISDELERDQQLKRVNEAKTKEVKKQLQVELEEKERTARRRSLGNIRFIGELFKLNMLTSPIMHDCVKKLIRQGDEDSLECLCRLLTTIGKELDTEKSKKIKKEWMCNYFQSMQQIVKERKTSSRIRFMLQDVIDLRVRDWVPRREENTPKTIDEIHREVEEEEQQQQIALQQTDGSKRSDYRKERKSRTSNPSSKEWTSVSKQSPYDRNPNKIRIPKLPTKVENIQLGSSRSGFSMWGKGCSGAKDISHYEVKTNIKLSNRYSAFDQGTRFDSSREMQRASACEPDFIGESGIQRVTTTARKTPAINVAVNKEREQLTTTANKFRNIPSDEQQTQRKEISQCQEETNKSSILRGKDMSEEEMESKTKPLIDELLHNRDVKEATECFLEIASENTVPYFVTAAVNQALERSNQDCNIVGEFLYKLVCKRFITIDQYIKGFTPILELAEDLEIDIPRIWECLGGIVVQTVQDGSIRLTFLKDFAAPCVASGTGGKLIAHIFKAAAKSSNVGELWLASGLQLSDFLCPSEDVGKFIEENCLEFLVDTEIKDTPVL